MRPAVRLSALGAHAVALGVDARLGRRSARTGRRTSRSSTTWRSGRSRTSGTCAPADANETVDGVADRAGARGRPGRARALAPEAADARPHRGRPGRGRRCAARTRSGSPGERLAGPDPARDRLGGRRSPRGARADDRTCNVRVVSMPCWELFAEQPQDYRDEVIPPDVTARLSVEAGISLGWERWVGDDGRLGRDRPLRRVGARRRGARDTSASRADNVRRRRARRAARAGRGMRVAVAFDHRGVKLRERILEDARRARPRGRRPRHRHRRRSASTTRTRRASSARRSSAATPSAASSSAARASAPRSPPARWPGSAPRSATTSTRRTRASSTTT